MLDLIFAKGASIRLSDEWKSGHGFWMLETEDIRKIDRCWRLEVRVKLVGFEENSYIYLGGFLDFAIIFCYTFLQNLLSYFGSAEN